MPPHDTTDVLLGGHLDTAAAREDALPGNAQTERPKPATRPMRRQARSDARRELRCEPGDSDLKSDDAGTRANIDAIVRSLWIRLGEIVDLMVIEAAVTAELDRYSSAPIKQYIPILVERRVFDQLGRRVR